MDATDIDILARTLWGEARGEGRRGMAAVASVVMNRVNNPRRWANDVKGVVLQRAQFSAWNMTDPNRRLMQLVTTSNAQFREAMQLAELAIKGELKDETGGADHFHTHAVNPVWSRGKRPTAIIGGHRFFKLA